MKEIKVILVDEHDNEVGTMPKLEAHQKGILHRAVSVFLFDLDGNWILQKRAEHKYHSANLWTNTCCSHPYPEENTKKAAQRRLIEEMGIDVQLTKVMSFVYRAELDNNMIEHEFDHVFIGFSSDLPKPNKNEVSNWKIISFEQLDDEVQEHPEKFTEWFKLIYKKVNLHLTLSKKYIKN
ncbi:MAG: isopentenyl-diphosphate delta-isomerase [Bacteroidetes bacterium HGW-Bacteroidetes-12]|nr:MAG: isopentenyl-diphosphate delta-isomerase [Bacteroidetes bacterium HGW-Bacteroidetes-12]